MRTVRAEVAYDGSRFHGFQRQDGFDSVQGAIEDALADLLDQVVVVHGAGRTDTGVHALRQVVHFQIEGSLADDRLRHALNHRLVDGVVLNRLETCRPDFHARFHAIGKRYAYLVRTARFRPPIGQEHSHFVSQPLDLGRMRAVARELEGEHDFRAFGNNNGVARRTTVRHVQHLRLVPRRTGFALVVQGNGFLYNMVRTLAGTVIDAGRGKLDVARVRAALETGERVLAGPTAPACGLYLVRVLYPEPVFAGRDGTVHGAPGLFQD